MELQGKALSASMIKTFIECKRKFQKRYGEKVRINKATDHLPMGSAFHIAMENANQALKEGGPCEDFSQDQKEDFLDAYRRLAVKLGLGNRAVFEEGLDLVEKALGRMSKDKIIVGVEKEFHITTPDGVPIMGYMDAVEVIGEDEILLTDYKTSRIPMSSEEAREDVQLSMYDYAVSVLYPQYTTIWVQLDYIRFDKPPVRIKRTSAQRQSFLKFLKAVHQEMLDFEPTPEVKGLLNQHCAYCDYKEGCNEYLVQVSNYSPNLIPVESLTGSDLVTERESLKNANKAIDARLGQIDLRILEVIEREDQFPTNDTKQIYLQQGTSRVNDVPIVMETIPMKDLLEYGIVNKVNNKGLQKYFQSNPNRDLQQRIDSKANTRFNNPSIRTKKAK